jgi:photosystem II stability/assembly factor-like uncharacterized protein
VSDVLIGTKKGLFLHRGGETSGPLLTGWEVFHAVNVGDTILAAANSAFFGPSVQRSTDGGETWERDEGLGLPESSGLTLERVWHLEPMDGKLLLGGAPGCLFESTDGGVTWQVNEALMTHPTRERWHPGAGGMCTHSIQRGADGTLYIAISAAGAFRSDDDGASWTPINKDVAADFLPDDPYPDVGQCVHKLLVHPAKAERLWQQNHCGVYRSDDRGDTWERLDKNGLPSDFGFPIMLDPSDPDSAWVLPEDGAGNRVVSGGRIAAWRTRDAGETWALDANGLADPAWTGILREASSFDGEVVYFGTQSGSVYAREHDGDHWTELAAQLPPVYSVEVWR